MRLKLDENLGQRWIQLLREAGHDVLTVLEEGLSGADDFGVIGAAGAERCCFVTLDLDFANPLRFRPSTYAGIAVLRLRAKTTQQELDETVATLVAHLARADITGRLWIVEVGRVREYQPLEGGAADP